MGASATATATAAAAAVAAAMGVPAGGEEAEEDLVSSAGSAGPIKAAPEEGGGIGPMKAAHSRGRFADGDETMGASATVTATAAAAAVAATKGVPAGGEEAEGDLVRSAGSAGPMKAAPEEGGGIGPM